MSHPAVNLPDLLASLVGNKDALPEDVDETDLSYVLESRLKEAADTGDDQRKLCFAEIAALQMRPKGGREKSRWGTHFGPVVEATLKDGSAYCFPDIAHIDETVIEYWTKRAAEVRHPVFRARYADVLWDLSRVAIGKKPSIDLARQAIDAYIECGTRFPNSDNSEDRLERALELALSIGDKARADAALTAMFRLLGLTEYPGTRLGWLFDLPSQLKGILFSPEQEKKLVEGLEAELEGICGQENPVGIVAKEPALRLARYYEKKGQLDDARRVIR